MPTIMTIIDSLLGNITYFFCARQSLAEKNTESLLRSILRTYPRWAKGHFRLAKLLFEQREWSEAFVSVSAAKILKFDLVSTAILEAKIFMQVGRPGDALKVLSPWSEGNALPEIVEEVIAAYIQLEEYPKAYELFKKIPDIIEKKSSLKAAHDFVQTKI